ncbi:methyl-accepting chemotaxis protein [Inconstantimicrobium mannanitabidum]|uniref:Methyl-accepting chemotaxis protein n=1 Tax=Inconstantimicrobium mannanitabidum TaxID=1604901 RepID=A0ACB5RIG4_9CLOT|nr:methyl-accepting chemotaxis protein [Clostridium sp. TW13]GKX68871.1 methyl-accepting chemotaxis protein [Clostridium sp. TW13]
MKLVKNMNLFKNMKLSLKIGVLSLSFLIFLVAVGIGAVSQVSVVNSKLIELNDSRLTPIVKLENLKANIEYIKSQSSSIMNADTDADKKTIQEDLEARATATTKELQQYKGNSEYATLLKNYEAFITAKDSFIKKHGAGTTEERPAAGAQPSGTSSKTMTKVKSDMETYDSARKAVVDSFDVIINKQVANATKTYNESKAVYARTICIIGAVVVVCAVISLVLSVIIIRSVTLPVKRITTKLKEISSNGGDLTQRIGYDSKDEIGQLSNSFDLFVDKLQVIIKDVAESAETIASSSEELSTATGETTKTLEGISSTIVEISSSTSDAAAVSEETNASLAEIAMFSESTSSASKNTTINSKKAKESAQDGAEKISEVVSSITDIASSSKEVSSIIKDLDVSSKKIGDIIKIITSISEQTNLLALNAAIEAARAGEAGKGFSVVAEEIRKLADESSSAASEIAQLVNENQIKSASAVDSVETVEQKVLVGVHKASEVGESINNIIKNIQNIVNDIERIDEANQQQAASTKEMETAIGNIAATSNDIAEGTENMSASIQEQLSTMSEIESTSEQLSEMAQKLKAITSGFRV